MDVKISIIIPFFNGEKYLEECVISVTAQTLKEIEIILVDDGSSDGSAEISERLMSRDDRIKLLRQENKGVSTARNNAIKEAKGEYLMFVDADDRLKTDACEILYNSARETNCDVVTGEYDSFKGEKFMSVTDGNDRSPRIYTREDIKKLSLSMGDNRFFQYVWRRIFSSKLIKENKISFHPDIAIGEDTLFCLESFLCAKSILNIPVAVYEYRQNTQGVMRSQKYNRKMTQSILLQYTEKKRMCREHFAEYEKEFLKGAAKFSYETGCRLLFDNLFFKGNGGYGEYREIVKSEMLRDMFKYFDIGARRSKSLDWVALKLISLRLSVSGYIIETVMYKMKKRRKKKNGRNNRNS